jgi:hypothetical protein
MTRILSAACPALLAAVSLPAGAHGTGTTVKPLFHRAGNERGAGATARRQSERF